MIAARRKFVWLLCANLSLCLSFWPNSFAAPATLTSIRVVDGDSINLGTKHIRLFGIDAPELHQQCRDVTGHAFTCGYAARRAMQKLVADKPVTCTEQAVDKYGRSVAICFAGEVDLGRALVLNGWAIAYSRYSTMYEGEQSIAEQEHLGLWAGSFEPPWKWRRRHHH